MMLSRGGATGGVSPQWAPPPAYAAAVGILDGGVPPPTVRRLPAAPQPPAMMLPPLPRSLLLVPPGRGVPIGAGEAPPLPLPATTAGRVTKAGGRRVGGGGGGGPVFVCPVESCGRKFSKKVRRQESMERS